MKKNNLESINTKNYQTFLKQIKEQIRISQIKAITSVNQVLIVLYYNIVSKARFFVNKKAKVVHKL